LGDRLQPVHDLLDIVAARGQACRITRGVNALAKALATPAQALLRAGAWAAGLVAGAVIGVAEGDGRAGGSGKAERFDPAGSVEGVRLGDAVWVSATSEPVGVVVGEGAVVRAAGDVGEARGEEIAVGTRAGLGAVIGKGDEADRDGYMCAGCQYLASPEGTCASVPGGPGGLLGCL
jgi:hypothetical protein